MRLFSSPKTSFLHFQALLKQFSSTINLPTLKKIPIKYRSQVIKETQQVLTDYLHSTRALPLFMLSVIAIIQSITSLNKSFQRYYPINDFGFSYESIDIDYVKIDGFLKSNVYFFCDNLNVLEVVCTLTGFGFPWNKLGLLYVEKDSIFERKNEFLALKFNALLETGFSNEQAVGICLGFPCLLCEEEVELSSAFGELLDELKRGFVDFDLGSYVDGNVDVWYDVCKKMPLMLLIKIGEGLD